MGLYNFCQYGFKKTKGITIRSKGNLLFPDQVCFKNASCLRNGPPWTLIQYKVGPQRWNKFKFDIAFFRGVNENKSSYFAIDDIQVRKGYTLQKTEPNYAFVPVD